MSPSDDMPEPIFETVMRPVSIFMGYDLICDVCKQTFRAKRTDARVCGARCRMVSHRKRKKE